MRLLAPALALLALLPALGSVADAQACAPQPVHSYGGAGAFVVSSPAPFKVGSVVVWDTNACIPFDGDYDAGVGGGFFGWGPWAATCSGGVNVHGPDVIVHDIVLANAARFEIGADDTTATGCLTNGIIAPGVDPDDCLTAPYVGMGRTCGAGGDGGYWVIVDFPATNGVIVAGSFGAPLNAPHPGIVSV